MSSLFDPALIPQEVIAVGRTLNARGHQAYLVGGSLRDLILGRTPSDYDIATDARPEEVAALFPRTVPVGVAFGSVLVEAGTWGFVDVTTFRKDLEYVDGRRPRGVEFGASIEDDLARRDFTVNALAWEMGDGRLVDPFGGLQDLREGIIRAVGDPARRFREDALRTLRAVRFAGQLGFDMDPDTWQALQQEARGVRRLSGERVRDELFKILVVPEVERALWMLHEAGLLLEVLPELKGTERLAQYKPGAPMLLDHLILTAALCPPDPLLRLAGLLHDVGKMATKQLQPDGRVTYFGHAREGGKAARRAGARLRLSNRMTERLAAWVEMHMSLDASVATKTLRRWLSARGKEWLLKLVDLCRADAWASGWHGPIPHLDRIEREIEEIERKGEGLTLKKLAVDGHDVMRELDLSPGPRVGEILSRLLEAVLEDPGRNTRDELLRLIREIGGKEGLQDV